MAAAGSAASVTLTTVTVVTGHNGLRSQGMRSHATSSAAATEEDFSDVVGAQQLDHAQYRRIISLSTYFLQPCVQFQVRLQLLQPRSPGGAPLRPHSLSSAC